MRSHSACDGHVEVAAFLRRQKASLVDQLGVGDLPGFCGDYRGMTVVFKPPEWEVDGAATKLEGRPDGRKSLSTFVQPCFPEECFPMPHRRDFDHGFLHRLDIPSSGLVLEGVSFEGYHALRLQLNIYELRREYFVSLNGMVPFEMRQASFGIGGSSPERGNRSIANDSGKPALTYVSTLLQSAMWRSFVSIRIFTGRHHQIRAHMERCGFPTVTDAKYTLWEVVISMSPWDINFVLAGCPG
eukprot:gnl/MRDRNA2_/MRDRNA2_85687_c0_seq1.p1 gnl/MRDRNA2_/MRDRNA2_85687_c0~~gnl/MRDRNA2_/MRDRNA2_85687_c0_seq1.p1  ORF type:complete len:242 (+),score=28.98 gnl/MRDRNA2_/MRDRNA2_85687_c0_seq1:228-953(+)